MEWAIGTHSLILLLYPVSEKSQELGVIWDHWMPIVQ